MERIKRYILRLTAGPLQIDYQEYDPDLELHEYIGCEYFDITHPFDELNERDIDIFVDDEGLLVDKDPVFIFQDEKMNPTGYLVGTMCFLKHDGHGNDIGLTITELSWLIDWIKGHSYVGFDSGLLRGKKATDKIIYSYIVRPFETIEHRKDIERMKQFVRDNGGIII